MICLRWIVILFPSIRTVVTCPARETLPYRNTPKADGMDCRDLSRCVERFLLGTHQGR